MKRKKKLNRIMAIIGMFSSIVLVVMVNIKCHEALSIVTSALILLLMFIFCVALMERKPRTR
jgi:RsiW-degrading membrane proteinase PrsW (M82 family)